MSHAEDGRVDPATSSLRRLGDLIDSLNAQQVSDPNSGSKRGKPLPSLRSLSSLPRIFALNANQAELQALVMSINGSSQESIINFFRNQILPFRFIFKL
jgi:hypothetical protein